MNTVPPPRTRRESFADGLSVRIDERGSGRPILVLHGGGGPQTVAGISSALASRACVLTPTHPGFAGEPRPEWFDSIDDLALTYLERWPGGPRDTVSLIDRHGELVLTYAKVHKIGRAHV